MAKARFYHWNKCSTCRDARKLLAGQGVEIMERDFFKDPFTEKELRELIGRKAVSELFSWNSPSFKKLGLDRESLSDDELVRLMLQEPRLIRRPITVAGRVMIIGADKAALSRIS
ncbi:MAG: hypothetical protein FJ317_00585 [SAR202 cluster bacterium]|nr:hypothetical protein [SAR202 cluster bacterium]